MKNIITLLFFLLATSSYAQRKIRLEDSLSLSDQRRWFWKDGNRFTKVKDDCAYGIEFIFYRKNKKVIQKKCELGQWTSKEYRYKVVNDNGNHLVHILNTKGKVIFILEVQIILNGRKSRTEITYFNVSNKEYFILQSDGK